MRLRFPEAWAPPIGRLAQIPRGRSSGGKRIAEHGQPAPRPLAGGLILDHVPVLRQQSVLDANNVEHDPFRGQAEATKPACSITMSPSAMIKLFSYLLSGGTLLIRPKSPSRP